ncbi:hypothetical protein ElyMa_004146000 [Elysia marginata]|uniref:Uncharacterized protein n=1 Tax=Elysia marginata TaxID=1093978 RepID=A0AAV4GG33_9GAST|nr:hypothetical protein ElyMa_004146000 [Elysia marginata]
MDVELGYCFRKETGCYSSSMCWGMNSHKWSLTSGCNSSPHHHTSTTKCSGLTETLRNESFIYSPEYGTCGYSIPDEAKMNVFLPNQACS